MRGPRNRFLVIIAGASMALAATISATVGADQSNATAASRATTATAQTPARELVTTYCVSCHNQRLNTGNRMLDKVDADEVSNAPEEWEKVIVKLRSRAMPPPGSRRPDNATYERVATWLETALDRAATVHVNPGRPGELHRLNRTEYG